MIEICNAVHPTTPFGHCALIKDHTNAMDHYDPDYKSTWNESWTDRDTISGDYIRRMYALHDGGLRLGQLLFNFLPSWVGGHVCGALWDPFNRTMTISEIYAWIDNHLIFSDDGWILAVYHNNEILAERPV